MGKPYSRTNFLGNIEHYDENGKKTGESRPGFFEGTYVDYDAKGNKVGTSSEKMFGVGYNHYDNHGHKTGSSDEGMFGGYTHRDARGRVTGTSYRSSFDILPSGPNKRAAAFMPEIMRRISRTLPAEAAGRAATSRPVSMAPMTVRK